MNVWKEDNITGADYYHAWNNSNVSNNVVQDFMDLDEFFEVTTRIGPRNGSSHSFGFNANFSTPVFNTGGGINTLTLDSPGAEVAPELNNAYGTLLREFRQIDEAINSWRNDLGSNLGYYDGQTTTQQQNSASMTVYRPSPGTSLECNPGKDKRYLDRRRKNNLAAKRSRDAKRVREISVVERYNFLVEENKRLKKEIAVMQERADELGKGQESSAH